LKGKDPRIRDRSLLLLISTAPVGKLPRLVRSRGASRSQSVPGSTVYHFAHPYARASRAPIPDRAAGAPTRPSNGVGLDNRPIAKSAPRRRRTEPPGRLRQQPINTKAFHHGIRRRGGTILAAAYRQINGRSNRKYDLTSSIGPARDIIPHRPGNGTLRALHQFLLMVAEKDDATGHQADRHDEQ
jgi:hypothetical protein